MEDQKLKKFEGAKILVVDDDESVRRVHRRILSLLKDIKLSIEEAESGNKAIGMLNGGFQPDLIISDILMPDGTGVDLWNHIEQEVRALREKILFVTGGSFGNSTFSAFIAQQQKERRIFGKPMDMNSLLDRARGILEESKKAN